MMQCSDIFMPMDSGSSAGSTSVGFGTCGMPAPELRSPAELFRWTLDPAAAADAVSILASHPQAATGWAESLDGMLQSDPRTRDSIWQGVSFSLASLADPRGQALAAQPKPPAPTALVPQAWMHALDSAFHTSNPTGYLTVAFGRAVNGFRSLLFQLLFSILVCHRPLE